MSGAGHAPRQIRFHCRGHGSNKSASAKGIPKMLGNNFFLIGYRVFVRYTNAAGKRLRGLYILKSETDKKKMEFFGTCLRITIIQPQTFIKTGSRV
jgi:hypothetical protein